MHFPDFMKQLEQYKNGKLVLALENAFLGFDKRLTEEKVLQELKEIAGMNADEDEPGEGKGWFVIVSCTWNRKKRYVKFRKRKTCR